MRVRGYEPDDLAAVLALWESSGTRDGAADGLTLDQAVELITWAPAVALVAEAEGEIVGMALGSVSASVGWVHRLCTSPDPATQDEVADALLVRLEGRLVERGARIVAALASPEASVLAHLERRGYDHDGSLRYLRRDAPPPVTAPAALSRVGGQLIPSGLWYELKGLEDAKQIIERRVILPLSEPRLAARHAISPPKAIVLFGPPGTGKTTFAKGIASRLEWPFVEIQPSELAGDGADREARRLAEAFDAVLELDSALVFVDEVEDIASVRGTDRKVGPSVTNEFLKQVPRIRNAGRHLLVCATNWVGRLDPAFLRPGRFDYVLPVGPPDAEARQAIWRRYVDEITDEDVDVPALVDATEHFTPADIEFAARKAAQWAFEREHFERVEQRATTENFLAAVSETRPTLSEDVIDGFGEDTARFARY